MNGNITQILEYATTIGSNAFGITSLTGELVIPGHVYSLTAQAFSNLQSI